MKIEPISYSTNTQSGRVKDFTEDKDLLRASNFPSHGIKKLISSYLHATNLAKLSEVITDRSILVSAPFSTQEGPKNTIPEIYAEELAKKLKTPVISLNDYIRFEQDKSSRKSYNVQQRIGNDFSFEFKNPSREELLKGLTHNKEVVLIDDVITTGETLSHLSTYLNKRIGAKIRFGHALVAVSNSRPSDREMQRFSGKIVDQIGNKYSMREIFSRTIEYFEPYTHLKMVAFERMIVSPETAISVLNSMDQDKRRIDRNLQQSIARPAGRTIEKDKDQDREH